MGKKLIIKGADFSSNGIIGYYEDISSMFSFENGIAYSSQGAENDLSTMESGVFGSCKVDLSSYIGKKLIISLAKYTASSGLVSGYRNLLLQNDSTSVASEIIIVDINGEPSHGTSESKTINITEDSKVIAWSYFNKAKQADYSSPFYAYISD